MRAWELWCIDNHLKYMIYLVLILILPICLIVGMLCGLFEMCNEWKYMWRETTKVIKYREKDNDNDKA